LGYFKIKLTARLMTEKMCGVIADDYFEKNAHCSSMTTGNCREKITLYRSVKS
jgi:hypothetical protein